MSSFGTRRTYHVDGECRLRGSSIWGGRVLRLVEPLIVVGSHCVSSDGAIYTSEFIEKTAVGIGFLN